MLSASDCRQLQCPITHVLNIIEGKWSILILRELMISDRRTHELCKALPGISTKTLTQKLRLLEEYGIVERRAYAEVPPRVVYSLTAKGYQLQPVFNALYDVGQLWLNHADCDCSRPPTHEEHLSGKPFLEKRG